MIDMEKSCVVCALAQRRIEVVFTWGEMVWRRTFIPMGKTQNHEISEKRERETLHRDSGKELVYPTVCTEREWGYLGWKQRNLEDLETLKQHKLGLHRRQAFTSSLPVIPNFGLRKIKNNKQNALAFQLKNFFHWDAQYFVVSSWL